jgi:hypothetical protein
MAAGISTFILRPRVSGIRRPDLEHADEEDPGDFTNLEEDIPCISTCWIPRALIWSALTSQGEGIYQVLSNKKVPRIQNQAI